MKKRLLFASLGLVIGLGIGFAVGFTLGKDQTAKATPVATAAPTRAQLLALVNAERARNGVAPLKEDIRLDASAQMKAQDEVTYSYFGHISPAGSPNAGQHGYMYINSVGIPCKTDSENLAWNTDKSAITAKQAVDWWTSSPAHHAAMIDPKYSLTGFGIDGYQIVEHFCET